MSRNNELVKVIRNFYQKLRSQSLATLQEQRLWLLRTFLVNKRKPEWANAGFLLPTVAMVSLVVVLITIAILFRSFERSKNASNVRVNEAVMNAALPAIDRASAKLEQLLNDPSLPRSTPSDIAIYDIIKNNNRYNFGDETRLKLAYDINGGGITSNPTILQSDETTNTAWKFPVDTDNDGRFDTYTLYAIYFRSPTRDNANNKFNRARNPLEARTPPMDKSQIGGACAASVGTSASLVGDSDWYKSGGTLAKSFFVYTVNVPIEDTTGLDPNEYQTYKGNRGFSALEYQQDRERIPVNSKAVWFENDLEITPGALLTLNGAVHTNANLLASAQSADNNIVFRQVSSQNSCFYEQENGKMTVGGNFGTGNVSQDSTSTTGKKKITVDKFLGYRVAPGSLTDVGGTTAEKSTALDGGKAIGYNDAAYDKRISKMKNEALDLCTTCSTTTTVAALTTAVDAVGRYPKEVKNNFKTRISQSSGIDKEKAYDILGDELELYFRNRTMRVPFAKVPEAIPTDAQALGSSYATSPVFTGSGVIEVPQEWREITATNTGLTLSLDKLSATEPTEQKEIGKEQLVGDRMLLGNGLPAYWKNSDGQYVTGNKARQQVDNGTTRWNLPANTTKARTRTTQIQPQLNLGVTDRNDFWEQKAAEDNSVNPLANVGGLRIVTGAGIYVDDDGVTRTGETPSYPRTTNSFLNPPRNTFAPGVTTPTPGVTGLDTSFVGTTPGKMPEPAKYKDAGTEQSNIVVWSDAMPMTSSNPTETRKGDLQMRATAVYHYKDNAGVAQTPIACVSSYYDPTNANTARNQTGLPDIGIGVGGRSNNGVTYPFPGRTISGTNLNILKRQARLVFPNGRIANEPLRDAMEKYTTNNGFTSFSYADYSAIDTALCSLSILGSASPNPGTIAHGKIRERAFLDAREVKANQTLADYQNTTNFTRAYNLELEQRQPLEIRVTEIDIGYLAATSFTGGEYLLPKSGIIYATRDDALQDLSYATIDTDADRLTDTKKLERIKLFSQTDFKVDPTRRPNGIRLINGGSALANNNLARSGANLTYTEAEKGLILVSNLPVYVKGDFNPHKVNPTDTTQIEEFTQKIADGFYGRTTPDTNFACRPGRTGCPATGGDLWRPSTIISDSITLLSGNTPATGFLDGFRNEGDYDARNNALSIPPSSATPTLVNNFATNANWVTPATGFPQAAFKTSYLANGVTPVQRRAQFGEYLMEVCDKPTASECDQNDPTHWSVFLTGDVKKKASEVVGTNIISIISGTTAKPPDPKYLSYPRRVAFSRIVASNNLELDSTLPIPLGIQSSEVNKVRYNSFSTTKPTLTTQATALWFRTSSSNTAPSTIANTSYDADKPLFIQVPASTTTGQPVLAPVTQLFSPEGTPGGGSTLSNSGLIPAQWLMRASATTTFNSAFVSGNNPSRPEEESAGLGNFVRFLESWEDKTANISGSFIQFKRSSYSTGSFASLLAARVGASADNTTNPDKNVSIFDFPYNKYKTDQGSPQGTLPHYKPPTRVWGFDVALLSQLPDLFAQRFTTPTPAPPAEFFREVGKDDTWVSSLLCAKQANGTTWSKDAVPANYRPTNCPTGNYPQ